MLSEGALERLQTAALLNGESEAVADLVGYYERAQNDVNEYASMIMDEMQHYGVS